MNNKIFIVIPVHNGLKFTKRCLSSIAEQNYKQFEVILVDDGSNDGTASYFKKHYPEWEIIKGTGKWWWTRSMFEGVKKALKKSHRGDFILTMNNDCFFKSNYLKNIVDASVKNKRAITGSIILDAEKPTRVFDAGVRINWKESLIYGVANIVSNNVSFYNKRPFIKKLDTLPGKGTLIPVEVFKKSGNFNFRRLPHYIGDYEFFYRAKRDGFKLIVATRARLYNFLKQTGSSHIKGGRLDYKTIFHLLFGRKSKLNILDQLNFILLCCPQKHLRTNLTHVLWKLGHHFFRAFPFYYIGPIIFKVRLLKHNIPIYMVQFFPRVKKLRKKFLSRKFAEKREK